jgi:alkylhydroperoxidase/carboxymuconolactone decarboxylase family protein YurZ
MFLLGFISECVTYGIFIEPVSESNPRAPLTFAQTEIVILACLIPQKANRETLWHIRGALHSGMSKEEVEAVQQIIELVANELGVDAKEGMPRVSDVTEEQQDLGIADL